MRGKEVSVICYPLDYPTYDEKGFQYVVQVDEVIFNRKIPKFKMNLYSSIDLGVEPFRKFKVNVNTLENRNIERYLYLKSKNICISGMVKPYQEIEYLEEINSVRKKFFDIREKIIDKLTRIFDPKCSDLVKAMIFGDRSNLNKQARIMFYKSGVAHLLAISGFHFSLLAKILYNFLRLFRLKSRYSYIICILFIVFYSFIVGFHPSSVRASIMLTIYFLSKILFLRSDSINSLGVSLMLILLFSPNSSVDIGLFLSFLSSLSIILYSQKVSEFIFNKIKSLKDVHIFRYITRNVADSIVSTSITFPIVCIYFKYLNPFFIISNLFISSQIYIFFITILLAILFYYFSNIKIFNYTSNFISKLIFSSIEKLSSFPLIDLNYSFINLCISSILLLISTAVFLEILERNLLKLFIMSCIIILLGIISHQLVNFNSIRIYVDSSSILFRDKKESILMFNSESLDRLPIYDNKAYYKINCGESKIESDLKIDKNKIYKIGFWNGKLKILLFHQKNNLWVKIRSFGKIILICMNGADVRYLPKTLRNCDILILLKIPNKFNLINYKDVIYTDNSYLLKNNMSKLKKETIIANGNRIGININQNGYFINRGI